MFDRHPAMFEFALPLISEKSMQFLNGDFGRNRYKLLSQPFGFAGCSQALDQMTRIVKEDISKWEDDDEVALHEEMMKIAINIITKTNFGCHFEDSRNCDILNDGYWKVINDLDDALLGLWSFGQGDAREKEFEKNLENFKLEIKNIVKAHVDKKIDGDYDLAPFLDAVLDNIDDEDDIIHQAITFLIGGFHTSATYMTWFF
jgi:cytochrome P450 family 20 subfamily A